MRSCIVWDKTYFGMGNLKQQFAPQHEMILWATKGNFKFPNKRPVDMVTIKKLNGTQLMHPNEKPVPLLEHLIEAITKENDTVLDCFMGSGSTGVACQNLNRNFIGIELDENYYKLSAKRMGVE